MELFTVSEISEKLKLSIQQTRKLIRAGVLKAHTVGKRYRVSEQQLDDFLKGAEK